MTPGCVKLWQLVTALSVLILLSADLPLRSFSIAQGDVPILSPEVAAQQAEKMTPEKMTQVEIDDVIRDRLRFDPQWQPLLQSIRQDIISLKWGDGKLNSPVWQRFGAKAYPLLEYYSHSRDEVRQKYGVTGILNLGKPYTTRWLTKQIQRRANSNAFSLMTSNPETLLKTGAPDNEAAKNWQQRFGLEDFKLRARLIQLAKANLEPLNSPDYYDQFNLAFLESLTQHNLYYSPEPQKPIPNISEWLKFERFNQPSAQQIQDAIAVYRHLPTQARDYLLVEYLGKVKAGQLSPLRKALLQAIASDSQHSDQIWAIAELDRHGDAQASAQLEKILNGDLRQLYPLTRSVFYGFGGEDPDRGTHAYYLLLGMAQKYPQSKFIRGCREYGDLTGRSYFGGEPRTQAILDQIRQKSPAQQVKDWQNWLDHYGDHPGADDATDFLARSLQAQGDIPGAMRLWLRAMTSAIGDSDALYLAYPHVRSLLDVGLSPEQIQIQLQDRETATIAPLLQYALAVKYARSQNYAKALETSDNLDLTKMPTAVLDSYYNANWAWWENTKTIEVQKEMQTLLTEQRQRWNQLLTWQKENTPESRYQIASNWSGEGGWKNGYLPVWNGFRTYHLPTSYSTSNRYPLEPNDRWDCRYWWVCDVGKRGEATVRSTYQTASQNGVALALYQQLLDDSKISATLREKTLYMAAMTLLWQLENHNPDETFRIHPPAGVPVGPKKIDRYTGEVLPDIEKAYQTRIDGMITELQVRFPKSAYIDDLLFSSYFLTVKSSYLKQLVERYPNSDRAQEAQYLLAHSVSYRYTD